jgi:hypothetical protein
MRSPSLPLPSPRTAVLGALAVALLLPGAARADLTLLDDALQAPDLDWPPGAPVRVAASDPQPSDAKPSDAKKAAAKTKAAEPPGMDFDLLGAPKPPPPSADAGALRLRRTMLTAHQGIGFGLIGLELATTIVGQLNYSDRFHGGPSTARYQLSHAALAYTTLGVFAVNGVIALLAPSPIKKPMQMDRVMVHRIGLFTAAAGMAAQGVLGVYTRQREGYLNQERLATTHLAIGYVTLAAMAVGVGAIVF